MKTLAFGTRVEAEDRSRSEWEKVLGRPKNKADVTEFLWAIEDAPDGTAVLVIDEKDAARLSKVEAARLVMRSDLMEADDGGTVRD
jgi:hypothetical protein